VWGNGDDLRKDTVSPIKLNSVTVRLRAICDKLEKALGDFQVPLLAENQEPAKLCEYWLCGF
jgi:hypothetical protein